MGILKQAEVGVPVRELMRKEGISEPTFYRWKKQYVELEIDQVRQRKQLPEENQRRKRLVAELTLDKTMLQDVLAKKILKPPRRRQVVQSLRGGYGVSERRACGVSRLHRGTYRYHSHQDPRTELRMRMREIAAVRVRYGYRKILVLLQREGWAVGKTMVSRLYREEGLALRRTVPRKRRVAVERREHPKAAGPNPVWSLDFVSDPLADGRRFRALTVVDVYTRESLAIEPGQSLKEENVVQVLQRIQRERGGA